MLVGSQNLLQQSQNKRTSLLGHFDIDIEKWPQRKWKMRTKLHTTLHGGTWGQWER